MRYSDQEYIDTDPYESDRDVTIRARQIKMVVTRKPQQCAGVMEHHTIPAGTRARYERAIVDDEWGSYYVCTECLDEWLDKIATYSGAQERATPDAEREGAS